MHSLRFLRGDMNETRYRRELEKRIEARFPGCLIFRNNPHNRQGIPDLLILHNERWGALEVKINATADVQPNQPYYVDMMDEMSFAAFIYPENEEEVLGELQHALTSRRASRVS